MNEALPLNALRSFEAVARSGSFTRAAAELHVTQSAISHQVKLLEDWLGNPLFERHGNSVKLRPHATLLAQALSHAMSDMESACRRARSGSRERALVIAVIPSVATCWLIPKMSDFRARFPAINTRVIYAIYGQAIDFNDVDVAIVYAAGRLTMKNVKTTRLLPGDCAPVCSPAFLELQGTLKHPREIVAAGVLHDTDRRGWARWLKKAASEIEPREGPVFEDFNLLRAATLAGQGISLCPLSIIADDLEARRLIQLSPITVLHESAYYLLEPSRKAQDTRGDVDIFRQWLFDMRRDGAVAH